MKSALPFTFKRRRMPAVAALILAAASTAMAANTTAFTNLIHEPLTPGNVFSAGFEALGLDELGDGIVLTSSIPAGATLQQVSILMSSYACQSGTWTANCVSADGASFNVPITVTIYHAVPNAGSWAVGSVVATTTQTVSFPYRPSANAEQCTGADSGKWYFGRDKKCYYGRSTVANVNFSSQHIGVSPGEQLIVTVAYNTSTAGYNPVGITACTSTVAGCPYDALNVATDSTNDTIPVIGAELDATGIFVSSFKSLMCGASPPAVLKVDDLPTTGCDWSGGHPQIEVDVQTNSAKSK